MLANESQVGGTHYNKRQMQPWDYIVANELGFLEGSIIKYVTRYKDKNGIQDLEKAKHFLEKLIEVQKGRLKDSDSALKKALSKDTVQSKTVILVREGHRELKLANIYFNDYSEEHGGYRYVGYNLDTGSRHYFNEEHIVGYNDNHG